MERRVKVKPKYVKLFKLLKVKKRELPPTVKVKPLEFDQRILKKLLG